MSEAGRTTVIVFGATGDLARHKLFPALAALERDKPDSNLQILAVGRRDYTTESFAEYLQNEGVSQMPTRLTYYKMNMLEPSEYEAFVRYVASQESADSNRIMYLAIPPEHYTEVLSQVSASGLAETEGRGWCRVVIEKPFGSDQASAKALDAHCATLFNEEQLYRVDHYLGKETVQNILAFRFANKIFESVWDNAHIDHVQITVAEDEGIKQRGPYYDKTGAFRDLVQNHVLQLLSFVAMEEPEALTFEALSDKKLEVLRSVTSDSHQTVFGQYTGYQQEAEVDPASQTETYGMTRFDIATPRWQGVPFYVRTGKQLPSKLSEIIIQFKPTSSTLFTPLEDEQSDNILTLRLQPDEGIGIRFGVKTPRYRSSVQPMQMEFCYGTSFKMKLPDAYELIFMDVLEGERIHALRSDCIEESWRIIDAVLALKTEMPLHTYEPGSWGPEAAEKILVAEGRRWLSSESELCNGIVINPVM